MLSMRRAATAPRAPAMAGATLLAVAREGHALATAAHSTLPQGIFSRVIEGSVPADFAAARDTSEPLVVLLRGVTGARDVLRDVLQWTGPDGRGGETKRVRWVHSYRTGIDAFGLGGSHHHQQHSGSGGGSEEEGASLVRAFDGVPFTTTRGVHSAMLAEYVLHAVLHFNRKPWLLAANKRARRFDRFQSTCCTGQTVGIIGYGDIGRAVAQRVVGGLQANVIGLRSAAPVAAYAAPNAFPLVPQGHPHRHLDRGCDRDDLGTQLVYGGSGLASLLATSDVVVNLLPLTPATTLMLRAEHFDAMRESAIFVNIGRGGTVDEPSLAAALDRGAIRGAAVDVFQQEPLPPSSPFWRLGDDRLLLSPHNAVFSPDAFAECDRRFAEAAATFVRTGVLPAHRVCLHRGY